jgi:sorting nexin-8
MLPALPPKKLTVNGRYLAIDDSVFLDRRRKALNRLLTFLINHPVLSKDAVLRAFTEERG